MENEKQPVPRTLGCDGIITGCSGAILGALGAAFLTLWCIMKNLGDEDEIGQLTIPILMFFAMCLGAPIGSVLGRIINKVIKRKMRR